MSKALLHPVAALYGQPKLPPDKSMSHRALMMAALAHGPSTLHQLSGGEDVGCTKRLLQQLGVHIDGPDAHSRTLVHGQGPRGLTAPKAPLDCGNSGTTMRLMMGLLAGLGLPATLVGDGSLMGRPMARVAEPLRSMGACIELRSHQWAPVQVRQSGPLHGLELELAVASGQLKGALLLAGLSAQGTTTLTGALGGRDHTERMLGAFGARVETEPHRLALRGGQPLAGTNWTVPQDMSAAAFWLGASQIVSEAQLTLKSVGLNATRTGLLQALLAMGADIEVDLEHEGAEPWGTLRARSGRPLRGITLTGHAIAPIIDELPLLMVLALRAQGVTNVRDAAELRVKECDRLSVMAENLQRMGARITLYADGFAIEGPQRLRGAELHSAGDHRVAMALSIASMVAQGPCTLNDAQCVAVSDPQFFSTLAALTRAPRAALEPN